MMGKLGKLLKQNKKTHSKPRRIFEGYSCQLLAVMLGAPGSESRAGEWNQSPEKQLYSSPVQSCA